MNTPQVILIEDNIAHVEIIRRAFDTGHEEVELQVANSLTQYNELIINIHPDIILADMNLPDGKGLDLLSQSDEVPVIVMTSFGNEEIAVDAMRRGAFDYIVKSEHVFRDIPHIVKRALREWSHIQMRKSAQIALKHSEERYRAIVENSLIGIFTMDVHNQIIYANDEFANITDCNVNAIIDSSFLNLVKGSYHKTISELHKSIISKRTQSKHRIEIELMHRDGSEHVAELTMAFYISPSGEPQVLGQLIDITHRKLADQHKLQLALEKEKVNLLHLFIGNVTHDFKTPIAVIKMSLYFLEKYQDPVKRQEKINAIGLQIERLSDLIQNLLALTRLDYNTQLDTEPQFVEDLIQDVISYLLLIIERKHLRISLEFTPDPQKLHLDTKEFRQALLNLIENAVNYTPDGGEITILTKVQNESYLVVIQDTGIGIHESDLDQIFNRFYRSTEAKASIQSGSGIGLAIVKRVVEMHDGEIDVASKLGEGTTFTVTLPLPPV